MPFLLRAALFAVATTAAIVPLRAQQSPAPSLHKPIVPVAPEELIRLLPPAPGDWKLTESKASSIFMEWMRVQATREYLLPPPPVTDPAPKSPPPAPQTTRITIYDTGYFPAFSGDFESFTPGKFGAGESLLIGDLPAHRVPLGDDGERLRVSVRRRFIVEIDTRHQPADAAKTWLRSLDLNRLRQVSDSGSETLPHPLTLSRLDELAPKNNTTSKAAWMSDDEFNANANTNANAAAQKGH